MVEFRSPFSLLKNVLLGCTLFISQTALAEPFLAQMGPPVYLDAGPGFTGSSAEDVVAQWWAADLRYWWAGHTFEQMHTLCHYTISPAKGLYLIAYLVNKCNLTGEEDTSYGMITATPKCPSGYSLVQINNRFYCQYKFKLAGPLGNPAPPLTCGLNPIELLTGYKYQVEDDIPPKIVGGVSFSRHYFKSNSSGWKHNYDKKLVVLNPQKVQLSPLSNTSYNSRQDACLSGWGEIKGQFSDEWAIGATANYVGGACQIKKNNQVVQTLPIVPTNGENVYISPGFVQLIRPNNASINFQYHGSQSEFALPANGNWGTLQSYDDDLNRWKFTTPNGDVEVYDSEGRLKKIMSKNGVVQYLAYDSSGYLKEVEDSSNQKIFFNYIDSALASVVTSDGKQTTFEYNGTGMISSITRPDNTHRLYHYEDQRFPTALTGITDERNVRYATWSYDAQGRAISSEHTGGADKGSLIFNTDHSVTLKNSFGKDTIYRFTFLAGANRVTKVEGQPTENCIGANQNYTYTPEGWLESKTDWKGFKTFYTYNTKGQEISRTEAYGTPLAKTISTEWHSTLNLKTKITEFNKETTYTYDVNGRLNGQTVKALSAQ